MVQLFQIVTVVGPGGTWRSSLRTSQNGRGMPGAMAPSKGWGTLQLVIGKPDFMLISVESDILKNLDTELLVKEFANLPSRNIYLV